MKTVLIISALIFSMWLFNCKSKNPVESDPALTTVSGDYFGQTPPGLVATRLSVGSFLADAGWFWHGSPAFSPDGQEVFFSKYLNGDIIKIYYSEQIDGQWTTPLVTPFDTDGGSNNPVFSSSGDTLYYLKQTSPEFIYRVTRTASGWTDPVALDIPLPPGFQPGWQFSRTQSGKLYFELWGPDYATPPDLYVSDLVNGAYTNPVRLSDSINTDEFNEFAPWISPDEDFLLFASDRAGSVGRHDIYVSFKRADGSWTEAVNLGERVNSSEEDAMPCITPDGLYLLFNNWRADDQGYNAYWISAQVIEDLRPTG